MRVTTAAALGMAVLTGAWVLGSLTVTAQVNSNDNRISMMDTCDPNDPEWPSPGCFKRGGDVSFDEFQDLVDTTLGGSLIGHPSWRNEPSHITARAGRSIKVTNDGGRGHTFTEVEEFGGGTIGTLNVGLTRAPECPAAPPNLAVVAPGASIDVTGLDEGLHKFQCCIHPWMRATIRVE
jgi:plastocyanin